MGQKIHPIGFRLSVNKNWNSRWFANSKNFAFMLNEDIKVREYLKKKLGHASVSKVIIERPAKDARITIFSSRPGVVIGKKGEDIEILKADLRKILGVQMVHVNIEEVRKPEVDAKLIADSIAQQLEKRIMFRRAMKRAMQNAMRLGAQGIKIMSAGRLNGAEIARTEWYREGRVPLHTLRADIDYGVAEAKTTYGIIGIKVWVYKGEVAGKGEQPTGPALPAGTEEPTAPKRVKRPTAKPEGAPAAVKAAPAARTEPDAKPKAAPARTRTPRKASPAAAAKPESDAPKSAAKTEGAAAAKPKTAVKRVSKAKATPDAGSGEKK
jgi:small subunit ribosomal protein S3